MMKYLFLSLSLSFLTACNFGNAYKVDPWFELAATTADDLGKAQKTAENIFEDIEYSSLEVTRRDLNSGKEETICVAAVDYKGDSFPQGNITFACDDELAADQAMARARSRVRRELLLDEGTSVPADTLETAGDWATDAAGVAQLQAVWDARFDLKGCVTGNLEVATEVLTKQGGEQCALFIDPGTRLDAFRANIAQQVAAKQHAVDRATGPREEPNFDEEFLGKHEASDGDTIVVEGTTEIKADYDETSRHGFHLLDGEKLELTIEGKTGRTRVEIWSAESGRRLVSSLVAAGKSDTRAISATADGDWLVKVTGADKNDGGSVTLKTELKRKAGGIDDKTLAQYEELVTWVNDLKKDEDALKVLWQLDEGSRISMSCVSAELIKKSNQAVRAVARPMALAHCLDEAEIHLDEVRARTAIEADADLGNGALNDLLQIGDY